MRLSFAELKNQMSGMAALAGRPKKTFSLFTQGFYSGQLIEIAGFGKTEFITQFLAEACTGRVAWIEKDLTINPYGLQQRGLQLHTVTFIETRETSWAVQQILQSQIFEVVVLSHLPLDERELRRCQLLVEKSGSYLFVLTKALHGSWVPAVQLQVAMSPRGLRVQVIKNRGQVRL